MSDSTAKVEIISAEPGKDLWEEACLRVARSCQGRIWDLPLWVVPDERHRKAAQVALLRRLGVPAIPTYNVCTLISLTGEILGIPVLDAFVGPPFAAMTLREILARDRPDVYSASCDSPGFAESFWNSLEDAESRGYFPDETLPSAQPPHPPLHFTELQRRLHEAFRRRGRLTAGEFLRLARRKLIEGTSGFELTSPLFIGPLFNPGVLEREFIKALLSRADQSFIIATPGSKWHEDIVSRDKSFDPMPIPAARISLMHPLTPETELDAAFGLIARWVAEGKHRYRDVRIIHPFTGATLPQIRSAAGRCRVPLKDGIARPLSEFPGVTLLLKLLNLFDKSWGREEILEILRSRIISAPSLETSEVIKSILNGGDKRGDPPGASWITLARAGHAEQVARQLEQLRELDMGGRAARTGARFAPWTKHCAEFIRRQQQELPRWEFEAQQEGAAEEKGWESLEALLKDFSAHFPYPMVRSALLEELKRAIRLYNYVPVDHRSDAVEICPGAREDHRPISAILYLSLNSRVPSPGRPSPFLETEQPSDYAERFRLFRLLIDNARQSVILSCPRYDDEGDKMALSPFLSSLKGWLSDTPASIEPESWQPHQVLGKSLRLQGGLSPESGKIQISRKRPLSCLRAVNLCWSPTQLDDAIQCPYLHFARDILGLEPLFDIISEGVVHRLLGSIAHRALERFMSGRKQNLSFDIAHYARDEFRRRTQIFDPHPEVDRSEAELVQCLVDFVQRGGDRLSPQFAPLSFELRFGKDGDHAPLNINLTVGPVELEGQIDRLDEAEDGRIIVIDYKYRKIESERKGDFFTEVEEGLKPQLPLYGLLIQDVLKKRPVALLQIYLRSAAVLGLRLSDLPDPGANFKKGSKIQEMSVEEFGRMVARAVEMLDEKAIRVANGRIRPQPRDFERCGPGNCLYADLCRYRQRWRKN